LKNRVEGLRAFHWPDKRLWAWIITRIGLVGLAQLVGATNRLAEAAPLYRRAPAIDERCFGPDHPDVALRLDNLAGLLSATDRVAEAEPPYRRALAIDEKCLGPDHRDVATRLNNLAALLKVTNRLQEGGSLMRRALGINEISYGPDHPKVAGNLNNLVGLLHYGREGAINAHKKGTVTPLSGRRPSKSGSNI
jgi:Tetratricopeptide repeat